MNRSEKYKAIKSLGSWTAAITMAFSLMLVAVGIGVQEVYADIDYYEQRETDWHITEDTTIEKRVQILGNVTLTIDEGMTLTATQGITVPSEYSLTIQGDGTLISNSDTEGWAGIGGDSDTPVPGTITINGCTITAQGGTKAAGIGGGYSPNNPGHGGKLVINSGTVNARAGFTGKVGYDPNKDGGAGIGGGRGGNGGTIIINGGTVTATEDRGNGAGMGAGHGRGYYDITINGGTVTAKIEHELGNGSAGMGAGRLEGTDIYDTGVIRINGGNVTVPWGNVGSIGGRAKGSRLELAWTNLTDSMDCSEDYRTESVILKNYYYDQNGTLHEPRTLTGTDRNTIGGKHLTPGVHAVEFYSDEETLFDTLYVEHGKQVTAPATNPTWQYGTFGGWFDSYHSENAEFATDDFNFTKAITEDTKVYAGWNRQAYQVRLLGTGWPGEGYVDEVFNGDEYTLPDEAALAAAGRTVPEHKDIAYWMDASNVKYQPGDKVLVEKMLFFQVVWVPEKHDVTFVDEDGTILKETKTYDYGTPSSAIDKPTDPAKARTPQYTYTFAGWATEPGQESGIPTASIPDVTENVTYYATYKQTTNKYTVTFKNDDGSVISTQQVEYGKAATDPGLTPREHYTVKWDKDFSNITGDLTVTAVYTRNKIQIDIWTMDGFEPEYRSKLVKTVVINEGDSYTLPAVEDILEADEIDLLHSQLYKNYQSSDIRFAGWSMHNVHDPQIDKEQGMPVGRTITPHKNLGVFADWVPYYIVRFVDEDGVTLLAERRYPPMTQAEDVVPPDATKAPNAQYSYEFTGWTPSISFVHRDATYTATYKKTVNKYTVTFRDGYTDGDGGILKTQEVEYGQAASAPENPTRQYHTFAGWDSDFSNIDKDTTVTAKWTRNKATITFDANGGTGGDDPIEWNVGDVFTLPTIDEIGMTAPSHKEFVGWLVKPAGGKEEAKQPGDEFQVTKNTVIKADWKWEKHSVTFYDEDGTTVLKESAEYDYGTPGANIEKPTEPSKKATDQYTYTFAGWATEPGQESGTPTADLPAVTGDAKYYATYTKTVNKYKVTFRDGYTDGDAGVLDTQEVEYGSDATAPADPQRQYYTFAGWEGDFEGITKDTTVTAKWTRNKVTISFEANGGSGSKDPIQWNQGDEYTMPTEYEAGITAPDYHRLDGWTVRHGETEEFYHDGNKVPITEDTLLIAHWTSNKNFNIHVQGIRVNGDNYHDVLGDLDGDEATVVYDPHTNTLTLKGATIEAGKMADGTSSQKQYEYGIRIGDMGNDFTIALEGTNTIKNETHESGTATVRGISYQGTYAGVIKGDGSLTIDFTTQEGDSHQEYYGIFNYTSKGGVTIDGTTMDIRLSGPKSGAGILHYGSGEKTVSLTNGAKVTIETERTGDSSGSGLNNVELAVSDDASLEITAKGNSDKAIAASTLTDETNALGALVNTAPTKEGYRLWDGETDIATYQYVKIPGESVDKTAYAAAVAAAEKAQDGIETSEDGKDVSPNSKWTTDEEKKALEEAIAAAKKVLDDPTAPQHEVDEALSAMKTATDTFESAVQPGLATYDETEGDGSSWTKGSNEDLHFTFERSGKDEQTFGRNIAVAVDGKTLTEGTDYTAEAGSLKVALKPAYLNSLSVGEHTITASFNDGEASAEFTIAEAEDQGSDDQDDGQDSSDDQGGDDQNSGQDSNDSQGGDDQNSGQDSNDSQGGDDQNSGQDGNDNQGGNDNTDQNDSENSGTIDNGGGSDNAAGGSGEGEPQKANDKVVKTGDDGIYGIAFYMLVFALTAVGLAAMTLMRKSMTRTK